MSIQCLIKDNSRVEVSRNGVLIGRVFRDEKGIDVFETYTADFECDAQRFTLEELMVIMDTWNFVVDGLKKTNTLN